MFWLVSTPVCLRRIHNLNKNMTSHYTRIWLISDSGWNEDCLTSSVWSGLYLCPNGFWGESIFEQRTWNSHSSTHMHRSSDVAEWELGDLLRMSGLTCVLASFFWWDSHLTRICIADLYPCYSQINLEPGRGSGHLLNDITHIIIWGLLWADSGSEEGIFISGLPSCLTDVLLF